MNRTARKVALSAAAGAVALALTSPAAVADDGDDYEGERDGYSEEYDQSESDDSDDDESEGYEEYDDSDDDSDDSDEDHEDGDEYDDDSDGREYDAYHEDHAEEPRSDSAYRGHGDGEKWGDQATGDAEEREAQTESFVEQQTAILTHLSRADAFLADLSERITVADLDPGLKNALLSLIDERRNHVAGLVAQVRTATSWEDLKSLRDDAYGEMTEPTT